ncbi:unnamed protein product, partial [Chrysoparadoxa australica]
SSYVAGATGVDLAISFTVGNPIPIAGTIELTLPSSIIPPAGPAAVVEVNDVDGTFQAVGAGQVVTIARIGAASELPSSSVIALQIPGFTNPTVSGPTEDFESLRTYATSGGAVIDEASAAYHTAMVPAAVPIVPATMASASVTPSSVGAGASSSMAVAFTATNPWPAEGVLIVEWPVGFAVPAVPSVSLVDPADTVTASGNGQIVTVQRTAQVAAAVPVSFTLGGFSNPPVSGSTVSFPTFKLVSGNGLDIENGNAAGVVISPGQLSSLDAELDSYTAAATGVEVTVSFTTANPLPATAEVVVAFPAGFDGITGTMASPTDASPVLDGSFAVSGDGENVIIARNGDGSQVAGGSSLFITLGGLVNPSSSTDFTITSVLTRSKGGDVIDETATLLLPELAITPASFTGNRPSWVLDSSVSGASGVTATISFTPVLGLPPGGAIELGFPAGFTLAGGALATIDSDGGLAVVGTAQAMLVARPNTGVTSTGEIQLSITGVSNPVESGPTADFVYLRTLDDGDLVLCEASAAFNLLAVPSGVTIVPATMASASLALDLSTVSVSAVATVSVELTNLLPARSSITVEFPAPYLGLLSVGAGDVTPLTGLGAGELFTVSVDSTTVTVTRDAGTELVPGTVLSFGISGISNPAEAADLTFPAIRTIASSGAVLEEAEDFASVSLLSVGVIISTASLTLAEGGAAKIYTVV